jgi:glycerophosphoryl diester phosphodiesterase
VPTLREVFDALPSMRFNIEPKQADPPVAAALCRLIRERGMASRVLVAAFSGAVTEQFRRGCPEVATSASAAEVASFLALQRTGLAGSYGPPMQALQVPEWAGGGRLLTADFVAAAHARGLRVHAWTVNAEDDMRRLLALGVDGVMTDYPDRLLRVLSRPAPPE